MPSLNPTASLAIPLAACAAAILAATPLPLVAAVIHSEKVTDPFPARAVTTPGNTFLSVDKTLPYTTGSVFLAGNADGTQSISVDDLIRMTVVHDDGSTVFASFDFSPGCPGLVRTRTPLNLNLLVKPGDNQFHFELADKCGGFESSSALYLVITDAPKTETYSFVRTWGSPGSGPGQFLNPKDVAVDRIGTVGDVWVADNNGVQQFDRDGTFRRVIPFCSEFGTVSSNLCMCSPMSLAPSLRSEDLYVLEHRCDRNPADAPEEVAWMDRSSGRFGPDRTFPTGTQRQLEFPGATSLDVSVEPGITSIYVTDFFGNTVRKFDAAGASLATFRDVEHPLGVAASLGNRFVYVVDAPVSGVPSRRVRRFDTGGNFQLSWRLAPGNRVLGTPSGIAVDGVGFVYVAEPLDGMIMKFDRSGTLITSWPIHGVVEQAAGIEVSKTQTSWGRVYVTDVLGARVAIFTNDFDADHIEDVVDVFPALFTHRFSDVARGGHSTGEIIPPEPANFSITDAALATDGVRIDTGPRSGNETPLVIRTCGGVVIQFSPNTSGLITTCPASPSPELPRLAAAATGELSTLEIMEGMGDLTYTADNGAVASVEVPGGNAVSVDLTREEIIAPSTNANTLTVVIGGTRQELPPGGTTSLNHPPVGSAGGPYSAECRGANTSVLLSGAGSSDPDAGDVLSYSWSSDCPGATFDNATGQKPTLTLNASCGCNISCNVQVTVSDGHGGTSSASSTVTISDSKVPTLSLDITPDVLWPANHKLSPISVAAKSLDGCDANPLIRLVSVTSSEPDQGLGDGDTGGDVADTSLGVADYELRLRAERGATGAGRLYVLCYSVTDASGNTATACDSVRVPRDQSGRADLRLAGGVPTLVIFGGRLAPVGEIGASSVEVGTEGFSRFKLAAASPRIADLNHDPFVDAEFTFEEAEQGRIRSELASGTPMFARWVAAGNGRLADLRTQVLAAEGELPPDRLAAFVRPNPAEGATTIHYALPTAGHVRLTIFDLAGREVARLADEARPAGNHQARLVSGATSLSPQVYVYRLEALGRLLTGRFVLIK